MPWNDFLKFLFVISGPWDLGFLFKLFTFFWGQTLLQSDPEAYYGFVLLWPYVAILN